MTPTQGANLLRDIGSEWLRETIGKRTTVQIECPHIIHNLRAANLTTKYEELGTHYVCGVVTTTARPGAADQNAGPLRVPAV